jgi:superoxide dismutase, Fe-Mn family
MALELPPLPYANDALEAAIDAETMQIHHDLHHNAYVTNANNALKDHADLASKSADELIRNLSAVPEGIRTVVRNNAGGHWNHSMFWEIMGPSGGRTPSGELGDAITSTFGSFDTFKETFNDGGAKRFGSGWVWLVLSPAGKLEVLSTPNQDNPVMDGLGEPIMGNDVWEHAYYLRYRNRRPEYLANWWKVVNWDAVAQRFAAAKSKG